MRFETKDGRLYDFKGVNHTLLFVVRYLKPRVVRPVAVVSTLNENYHPDFMAYERNQEAHEDESDDGTDPTWKSYREAERVHGEGAAEEHWAKRFHRYAVDDDAYERAYFEGDDEAATRR